MKRNILLSLAVFALLAAARPCAAAKDVVEGSFVGQDVFTRVNLRYDVGRKTGSFIQYLSLNLLPANTKVHIDSVGPKGFTMTIPDAGSVRMDYRPEWGGGRSVEAILPTLFSLSQKPVTDGIAKLSKTDQKGIRLGRALEGMSKEGVIAALGPLALHKTPSEEADTWTYWTNRFIFYHVTFKDDIVSDVSAAGR